MPAPFRIRWLPLVGLMAVLLVGAASASVAHDEASPSASSVPAASLPPVASAAPAASAMATGSPALMADLPLPDQVAILPADVPTVSVAPASAAGELVVGVPVEFALGHCGLWSPVDLDGSLWRPIGSADGAGGAIDSDEEIGELINATPGSFVLLTPDAAAFTSQTGVVVAFARGPGELEYPLCM